MRSGENSRVRNPGPIVTPSTDPGGSLPKTAITDIASTYGWDTTFGIHIADANAAIVRADSSPRQFNVTDPQDRIAATGQFGSWQISTGGSGELVRLQIPIQSAVITSPGNRDTVTDATALVDVRLNFLHQLDPDGKSSHHLKVRTTSPSPDANVASVWKVEFQAGQKMSFLAKASFQTLLELWLNANLDDFDHVFATVDLNAVAAKQAFQWMQPTDVSYAYVDLSSDDGLLVVLCMTGGRSASNLVQQASPALIPGSQRAGMLISKQRLLEELILPNMAAVFDGSKVSDYKLSDSGESILNAHKNIGFTVHPKNHDAYQASIQQLSVTIKGSELQMEVLTKSELSPGIYAYCRTQNFLEIVLVNKPDGTQTLAYRNARDSNTDHWTEASPGIEIAEELLAIAALVAAAVAIVASGGAAIGAAVLIIGLAAGVMSLTTSIIEDVGKNQGPSINAMVLNATAAITWPDSKDFELEHAGLADSLQLAGTPGFA